MIDELPTRAALTVAAFLLLGTGLSVLSLAGTGAVRDAAHGLAAHLARGLDALGALGGSIALPGGVGAGGPFGLPATLAGAAYRVEFRSDTVRVVAAGAVTAAALRTPVHPFAVDRDAYTGAELRELDASVVAIDPEDAFVVERVATVVDGAGVVGTFVHLPR